MRLITFAGQDGRNATGLMVGEDRAADLSKAAARDGRPEAWGRDMVELISGGDEAVGWLRKVSASTTAAQAVALADVNVLAPVPRPRKNIFCVGLNYRDHVTEHDGSRPLPKIPVFFTKPPTAVTGPGADIPWHRATSQLDYEIELGVVIGPGGIDIKAADGWNHVWGYTIINDVSARDLQRAHGGQWFKGKALDGACPMGPWIVHKSAVPEPANLNFVCKVSGEVRQQSNTGRMIFDIPALLESLSAGLTLEPGDLLATGTCSGVGHGWNPPRFLKDGDLVEMTIEGIGTLRNRVRRL